MKVSYPQSRAYSQPSSAAADYAVLTAGRDFTTLDGRLIPRALGEEALRQRTALLIGGMLIGNWPEQA
jgi:hypothetical protein